tara:strand:+ start:530 stop:1039 length:510 start_codon:yes stop_codon:yes gene_type:complete
MNRIDYELGLATYNEEDFSGADGKAKAAICRSQCYGRHLFSRGKRDRCKDACNVKYREYADYQKPPETQVTNYGTCPSGMTPYGDGSACKEPNGVHKGKGTCALAGNDGQIRCADYSLAQSALEQHRTSTDGTDGTETTETAGMSTGAKIGIGVGAVVLIGVGIYMMKK